MSISVPEEPGDPIAGSRYYREFCTRCKIPLRVEQERIGEENYCEECDPPHMGVGNDNTNHSSVDNDPDAFKKANL